MTGAAARAVLRLLEGTGRHARWTLVGGIFAALLFQEAGAMLRPALPFFVGMIFTLAMVRIDLHAMMRGALAPGRMARTLGLSAGIVVATPVALHALSGIFGMPADWRMALVYAHAAPPIASAAGLCLMMGLDAVVALEVAVVASLLTPFVGPVVVLFLLGDTVALDGWRLAGQLAGIVLGGTLVAAILRRALGPARIGRHGTALDGVTALGMLVFLLPVFDGVVAGVRGAPMRALGVLALVVATNFGLQLLAQRAARGAAGEETAGAVGVLWGNRNVTLFLAAAPENALFSLYVALYQFPMYFTPLVMGRLFRSRGFTRS